MPYFKDGFFSRDSWLAVLFGQGLMPRAYDRLADFIPREQLDAQLRELHARVAAHVDAMPAHAEVIARYCSEAQPLQPGGDDMSGAVQDLVIVGRDAPVWLVGLRDAVRARARGRDA